MSKFDDEYIAELYEETQTLTQRLHDAEAERDRLLDFRKGDGIEAAYRIFSDAVTERDAAQARIAVLEEALRQACDYVDGTGEGRTGNAYWSWLALLSPAPAEEK